LNGLSVADVEAAGSRLAKERLSGFFNHRMMERLEAHKQAGDRVVLLSGSPDFIVKHIASVLGVGDFIAARLAARKGRFISALPELHPFGMEKVRLAQEFCRTHDQKMNEAVSYADSISDLSLLERAGRAVAVTPEKKLEEIALARNWEILN
ncbi:MAG: HAD-IB family phosphatase, partial [Spirochaetota bacterium]